MNQDWTLLWQLFACFMEFRIICCYGFSISVMLNQWRLTLLYIMCSMYSRVAFWQFFSLLLYAFANVSLIHIVSSIPTSAKWPDEAINSAKNTELRHIWCFLNLWDSLQINDWLVQHQTCNRSAVDFTLQTLWVCKLTKICLVQEYLHTMMPTSSQAMLLHIIVKKYYIL